MAARILHLPFPVRSEILFYLNGNCKQVSGASVFEPLSSYLRYEAGLPGTKIVCEEGDCGACTVLAGRLENGQFQYSILNSCIFLLFQADGMHIITVEGLHKNGQLTPVQEAMRQCHGTQCGFCTPGFVVAITGICEEKRRHKNSLTQEDLRAGLTGNLCRCTGYEPILKAGQSLLLSSIPALANLYPEQDMKKVLAEAGRMPVHLTYNDYEFLKPAGLPEAIQARKAGATIVSGATDLGVQLNKARRADRKFLSLAGLSEFRAVKIEEDVANIGMLASWTQIEQLLASEQPEFAGILSVFASPQIKNAGGMVGNIINASPIADSLPYLMVAEAILELAGPGGVRELPILKLYQGYKKLAISSDEILIRVKLPLLKKGLLGLYKISKRRDLDISSFTAAIYVELSADKIQEARISLGGVGPVVERQHNVEDWLKGRLCSLETFVEAGKLAAQSIQPISDVRGSKEYRKTLACNVFRQFYLEKKPAT